MTEALASLAGVLIAGWLLSVEVWVEAVGILAWWSPGNPPPGVASPRVRHTAALRACEHLCRCGSGRAPQRVVESAWPDFACFTNTGPITRESEYQRYESCIKNGPKWTTLAQTERPDALLLDKDFRQVCMGATYSAPAGSSSKEIPEQRLLRPARQPKW
jgi:hypothetical protein